LRYTYLSSKDENGLRLSRYENKIVEDRFASFLLFAVTVSSFSESAGSPFRRLAGSIIPSAVVPGQGR